MSRYLGIDLGTSATKALVLDDNGRVLGKGRAGYPIAHPRVGWSEQDPRAWWTAVCAASRQALHRSGPGELGAVALSGQLNGLVLLDERSEPVADALIWLDQRATEEADLLNARFPELLRAATLNPANPIYVGAKLLWVRRHRPELLDRSHHLLLAKDYVNLQLTGEFATDSSDASCTLLYDLRSDTWIPELLEASAFEADRLPPLFHSTDVHRSRHARRGGGHRHPCRHARHGWRGRRHRTLGGERRGRRACRQRHPGYRRARGRGQP